MPVTDQFERRSVTELFVNRAERQRRELFGPNGQFLNKDGLVESVRLHGVLSPLLVHRSGEIIFGERRWTAAKLAGLADVPVRYVEDLSALEAREIELEENARRLDLDWRDRVAAIGGLHETYAARAEQEGQEWSQKATADKLQFSTGFIAEVLRVHEDLSSPRIERASSIREAFNALARIDERRSAEVMEAIIGATQEATAPEAPQGDGAAGGAPGIADVGGVENNAPRATATGTSGMSGTLSGAIDAMASMPRVAPTPVAPDSIIHGSFLDWAPRYAGQRFNLIHCDFPYGTNLFGGKWGGKGNVESYEDTKDIYERLIECLCGNLDRLMAHSGHLVFWLSADVRTMNRTLDMFAQLAGDLWFWPMPLVWHKTDNLGIASDPQRRGRHVYEVALVGVREDRKICKVVSDCYGAPTDKRLHPSCKPEPVLKHFLSAFVDEHTRMLDPTCGSASSLRAAEALGAESVLGLELDEEHAKAARSAMRQFRALRALERTGTGG